MNYQKIHDEIITQAKIRKIDKTLYYEKHHIIPKCLGGDNSKDNLVKLTAREHYIIHWLLVKIYKDNHKLISALHLMTYSGSKNSGRYASYTFKYARELWNDANKKICNTSENKIRVSKIHSGKVCKESTKDKLRLVDREYLKTQEYRDNMSKCTSGELNGMYGKKHTNESKIKMSQNLDRDNLSKLAKQQWSDDEMRKKMIASMKVPKKKLECPHCAKVGGSSNMKRYHFNKCKFKKV